MNAQTQDRLDTDLIDAARAGDADAVERFVRAGADVNVDDSLPLKLAASSGSMRAVKYLLDNGAEVENRRNGAALDMAAGKDNVAIMATLLDHGATITKNTFYCAGMQGAASAIGYLADHGDGVTREMLDEALRTAARLGHDRAIETALDLGADANVGDGEAFVDAVKYCSAETLEKLLDRGADVNAQDGKALLRAAEREDAVMLQFLWERGADFSAGNFEIMRHAKKDMYEPVMDFVSASISTAGEEFDKRFGDDFGIDDLSAVIDDHGTTGLILAAKAGKFDRVIERAVGEGRQFSLDDLKAKDSIGRNIYGLLNRRKALDKLVRPELWTGRGDEFRQLWLGMPEKTKLKTDFDAVLSAINRTTLREKLPHPPKLKKGPSHGR